MNDEQNKDIEERLQVLAAARDLNGLLSSPGWQHVCNWFEASIDKMHVDLKVVDTGKLDVAIAALQQWQIAQKFLDSLDQHIQYTLAQAEAIRGDLTLEDALQMEHVHEQQRAGDSGKPDPTGHF